MNKLIGLCLVLAVFQLGCIDAYEKVRIDNIAYLDLYRGRPTIGFKPIEQQICVDESQRLCSYYRPDYIHCVNAGTQTGGQVIWQCQAKLSNGISFGRLDVSCETYPGTRPFEGYVIRGSCGLRYTLRRSF